MTTTTAPPLLRMLASLEPALVKASEADPVYLSAADKREALAGLHQCGELLKALELRVLGVASLGDDVCEDGAFRSVVDLHAFQTRSDRRSVHRDHQLARALEQRWHGVAEALRVGECSVAQAEVIVRALEQLPTDLPAEIVKAERFLLAECAQLTPKQLKVLGRGVLAYIAPDVADDEEGKRLADEEARARETMSVHVRRNVHGVEGKSRITIEAPDATVDRFLTMLDAYTSPRHRDGSCPEEGREQGVDNQDHGEDSSPGPTERVPFARKRAQAFISLLEALDPRRLPLHGGDATTLIVTISREQLTKSLGVAGVIGGDKVSAGEARRLACTAKVLPMVLGGKSEPLDLGRASRLFSAGQRKAMAVRDRRCRAEGCDHPAAWCEAHHLDPWSAGGKTDIDDGVLLCAFHHHRIHDERYDHTWMPTGDVRFRRRR